MEWYRLTHPSENLDPFWVGHHQRKQSVFMASECEEKSGKVATPCCTHPIASLSKDACHIMVTDIVREFRKLFHF